MRRLPTNPNEKQKLIIAATKDFFGKGIPKDKEKRIITNVSLVLMGRKKGVNLTEEEQEAVWYIKSNLRDKTYATALRSP